MNQLARQRQHMHKALHITSTALDEPACQAICRGPTGQHGQLPGPPLVANICNRGQSGRGCQLEISKGLRLTLFEGLGRRQGQRPDGAIS